MNFAIVLLFVAGCGIYTAQTQRSDAPTWKGLIPLTAGVKCPIRACRRNEVLKTCGLCYENTCSGQGMEVCRKICYCGCYCKAGYVRATINGPCILPKQCPTLPLTL